MPKPLVLTGISGSRVGSHLTISKRISTVGSNSACDVVLQDRQILARHAELRQVLDRWFVVPLDPQARVFINGELVSNQGRVLEGDLVTIGSVTFKASFSEAVERAVGGSSHQQTGGATVPRLGDYFIRQRIVSQEQVSHALQRQDDLRRQGRFVQLGDVLCQLGYVTRYQLEHALQEQSGDFFNRLRD